MLPPLRPVASILLALLALTSQTVHAKKMYKWKDANGHVYFSDQVPPTQAELGHEELDKNANVVKVQERAKTKAEIEMEKRLEALKKQQEKVILEQQAYDKKLLSSFLDEEAMVASHKTTLQAVAGQEYELAEKLKELNATLAGQHREAADYEVKNKKVPPELTEKIAMTTKEIAKTKQAQKDLAVKKVKDEKQYQQDYARFKALLEEKRAKDTVATATADPAKSQASASDLGLFSCEQEAQCEKAWAMAREFVKTKSTTKINTDTDRLVMTDDPAAPTDMSLSISKMVSDDKKTQIFLDIRCKDANKGLCMEGQAQSLRAQFGDYIKAGLAAAPATPAAPAASAAPKK